MKKLILIATYALALFAPAFSQAAGYLTEQAPTLQLSGGVGTKYIAHYTVTTAPTGNTIVKVYSRFGEYGTTNWEYNVAGASLIDLSSSSQGASFNADFDFASLGVVAGKVYAYQLANSGTSAGAALTAVKCFNISGPTPCVANPTLDTSDFIITPGAQMGFGGQYTITLDIKSKPGLTFTTAIPVTLKVYKEVNEVPQWLYDVAMPNLTAPVITSKTLENLAPGVYSVKMFSGSTEISDGAGWQITNPPAGFTFSGGPTVTCASSVCDFKIGINVSSAGTLKMHVKGFPKHLFDGQPKVNGSTIDDSSSAQYAIGAQQVTVSIPFSDITTYANSVSDTQFWYGFHEALNNKDSNTGDIFDTSVQGITTSVSSGGTGSGTVGNTSIGFGGSQGTAGASGACGMAHQNTFPILTEQSANLCTSGVVQQFAYSGTAWTWNCVGTSGVPAPCNATQATDTNYGSNYLKNPLAPGLDTFPKIFLAVYNNIILPVAIPFIVLAVMFAGFKFVMARKTGTVDGYSDAKRILKYTLIGTALLLGGWVVANALQGTLNSLLGSPAPTAIITQFTPWA